MTATAASLLLLLLLLALTLYLLLPEIRGRLERRAGVGQPLPALELQPLTGAEAPLTLKDLAGQVVLVNFWGTWCPPCRAEMPHLAALRDELADHPDFRLLAVSYGGGDVEDLMELEAATRAYLDQTKLDLPTYADPEGTTRQAFDQVAGLKGFPTTFLLDREGVIRAIWEGYAPGLVDEMEVRVRKLLGE
jgi:thiol-disulfide isomerase/thioredoxin